MKFQHPLTPMCNIAPAGELGEDQGVQSTAVSRLKCCGGPLYPSYSVFVVHTYVHTVLQCSFPWISWISTQTKFVKYIFCESTTTPTFFDPHRRKVLKENPWKFDGLVFQVLVWEVMMWINDFRSPDSVSVMISHYPTEPLQIILYCG